MNTYNPNPACHSPDADDDDDSGPGGAHGPLTATMAHTGGDGAHGPLTAASGGDGAHGPRGPRSSGDGAHGPLTPHDGESDDLARVWAEGVARFKAARMWVARNRPYYTRALFACPVEFTEKADTLAVNGHWRMRANPRFTAAHTVEQVAACMIHEVNHLLRDHHGRALRAGIPYEGLALWSLAADFEVNDDLRDDGLDLPDGVLYPDEYGLQPGRLAEQYYQDMLDFAADKADDMAQRTCEHDHTEGPGQGGQDDGEGGLSRSRQEQVRRRTAQDVLDHIDNHGEWAAPTGLRQWAMKRTEPKIDWRRLLASELRRGLHRRPGSGGSTWSRPPRRPDDGPVLRPGTARPTADVAVVVDTSGSMQTEDHSQAFAEVHAMLARAVPGEAVAVYSTHHEVASVQTVNQARQIRLVGGGGTDMRQGIIAAARARPRPAVIIVITDGYTPWPPDRPPGTTATVIAVITQPWTAQNVPPWITPIEALAPGL